MSAGLTHHSTFLVLKEHILACLQSSRYVRNSEMCLWCNNGWLNSLTIICFNINLHVSWLQSTLRAVFVFNLLNIQQICHRDWRKLPQYILLPLIALSSINAAASKFLLRVYILIHSCLKWYFELSIYQLHIQYSIVLLIILTQTRNITCNTIFINTFMWTRKKKGKFKNKIWRLALFVKI